MEYQNEDLVFDIIKKEEKRQIEGIELIPSENYVSKNVLKALGSVLTNKYSEGYPGKRYYGGNEFIDEIENLAIERAKKLFGVTHANVQPYSGSMANFAVYFALLNPGDKIMGLDLLFGGHLTHGWKVNVTGKYFNSVQYKTGKDGFLDYDKLYDLAKKEKPKIIFCGATAYPRLYDYKKLSEIAHSIGAFFVADIAHEAGLIAGKVIPSPVGFADVITTTTHKTLRGPRGAMILCNGKPSNPLKPLTKEDDIRENLPTLIDRAIFPGIQGGPHNHQTAAIAVALGEAMRDDFKIYAEQIIKNAKALANALLRRGYNLVTGGTDNHLILIDLRNKNITGKEAETALSKSGITVNKNAVPWDERPPFDPSGIRLGTPAITTRGIKEADMEKIAEFIDKAIINFSNLDFLERQKMEVKEFMKDFSFDF